MNKYKGYSKMWFLVLLLVAFVAGCGRSSGGDNGGVSPDTTAPTLITAIPLDLALGVATNVAINANFSEAMDAATIAAATFTLKQGTTPVSGAVTYVGTTANFTPASNLTPSTLYTATITTGVKDLAGNALAANYAWAFTTGTTSDAIAPIVSFTIPVDVATNVALNSAINATFSEVMSAATLTTTTFTLKQGTTPVAGTVTYVGTTATFRPAGNLTSSTPYTATITTGAKDLAGNAMAADKVWSFTTGTTVAAGPAPVVLGTAGNYVILAKSAISTTGVTAVTGNLGLSPSAASFITGFSLIADATNVFSTSSLVTGHLFAADYSVPTPTNLTTAVLDMMTAYTDASGRAPDVTELGAGNIGGMTLTPGTYKWSSGVLIPADITLSGGPNDVWIFEIAQNLVMSSAARINLIGGAQAKNIFWQVFGIVDLGTTAHFEGIALVQTAITLRTGATVNGRLLAQTAVTLDAATVVQPAP